MTAEQSEKYHAFWDKLIPAYTISKGSMRLPISTTLTNLSNFNHREVTQELQKILQTLIDTHGTREAAITRAQEAQDDHLIPLITPEYTGVVRFDCIWNPYTETIKILEINCDYPDGLVLHDSTYSTLDDSPNTLHQNLLEKLFETDENIHVLFSEASRFLDGYHAEKQHLSKRNNLSIGHNTKQIKQNTTIRRCLETTKLTAKDISNIISLSPRLVNTISLRTLGYKNLLTEIDHPFIPETVTLTTDTKDYCLFSQDNLVLKPSDGCEGNGIYFGNNLSEGSWNILLNSLVDKNYIAQELVEIPRQPVSFYENEGITTKELYSDLCPHFFIKDGKVIGSGHTLMRFSENKIVNVSQGGGIGYHRL